MKEPTKNQQFRQIFWSNSLIFGGTMVKGQKPNIWFKKNPWPRFHIHYLCPPISSLKIDNLSTLVCTNVGRFRVTSQLYSQFSSRFLDFQTTNSKFCYNQIWNVYFAIDLLLKLKTKKTWTRLFSLLKLIQVLWLCKSKILEK